MSSENLGFFLIGVAAVVLGATIITMLVRSELAQASGVSATKGGGKLFLAAALGMGVVAFTVKLTTFTLMATMPKQMINPLMVDRHFEQIVPASWSQMPEIERKEMPYQWQALPLTAPAPADNPTTPEKIVLGKRLFFDPNLSSCGEVACATCHLPEMGFSDGKAVSTGCQGATGRRNSPTVYQTAYLSHFFWDGRVQSLEQQALNPVVDPVEMANTWDNVLAYLKTGVHPATGKSFPEAKQFYEPISARPSKGRSPPRRWRRPSAPTSAP